MYGVPLGFSIVYSRVTAQDSDGLRAEAIEIEIILCSGCNNQGSCDYNNTRNQTNNYFKLSYCNCSTGYSGMYGYFSNF